MILINGQPDNRINIQDRGLQYGDGLFETIAFRNGQPEFLQAHMHRLESGCQRLKIQLDKTALDNEINQLMAQLTADQVIKIIVTRGQGGRGYRITPDMQASRILSTHPMPQYPDSHRQQGIELFVCTHPLPLSPALAGIKHLNRLDQVMARSEWQDDRFAEGLMFDAAGHVIEGTMSNIFLIKDGLLMTPKLDNAGICGIMRAKLLEMAGKAGIESAVVTLKRDDIINADEMFVCNSLIGIWPVRSIPDFDKHFALGPITDILTNALDDMVRK